MSSLSENVIPVVHNHHSKINLINDNEKEEKYLRKISTTSNRSSKSLGIHRKKSISDISGDYCVNFDFWNDRKTSSRSSSVTSLISERPESRISFTSNVTGFEDELDALKCFLKKSTGNSETVQNDSESKQLSKKVIELNHELFNAKTIIENLKYQLIENKHDFIQDDWNKKYHDLLAVKDNLEFEKLQLELKIKKLKYEQNLNESTELLKLQQINRNLQQENENIQIKFNDLEMKMSTIANELNRNNLETIQIKQQYNENTLQLECKQNVVDELKEKIREQYCQIENLNINNLNLKNTIDGMKTESDINKRSTDWFKNELNLCKEQKLNLQERLIQIENENLFEKNKNNKLKNEINVILTNSDDIEQKALFEKECLLRKLIQMQSVTDDEQRTIYVEENKNISTNNNNNNNDNNTEYLYEIEELKIELNTLKEKYSKETLKFNSIKDENDQISLVLNENNKKFIKYELISTQQVDLNKQLNDKISFLNDLIKCLSEEKLKIQNDCENIKIQLERVIREKHEMDNIVEKLRRDFEIISNRYLFMKQELLTNNLKIRLDETEIKNLNNKLIEFNKKKTTEITEILTNMKIENNYELEMNHNLEMSTRKLCEMEKLNSELTEKVNKLNIELNKKNNVELDLKQEIQNLKNQIELNHVQMANINVELSELNEKYQMEKIQIKKENQKYLDIKDEFDNFKREMELVSGQINQSQPNSILSINIDTTEIDTDDVKTESLIELQKLKTLIKVLKTEHREKLNRYELNIRTLLKKVKEHMRARKIAESKVDNLTNLATECEIYKTKLNSFEERYNSTVTHLNIIEPEYNLLKTNNNNIFLKLCDIFSIENNYKNPLNLVNLIMEKHEINQRNLKNLENLNNNLYNNLNQKDNEQSDLIKLINQKDSELNVFHDEIKTLQNSSKTKIEYLQNRINENELKLKKFDIDNKEMQTKLIYNQQQQHQQTEHNLLNEKIENLSKKLFQQTRNEIQLKENLKNNEYEIGSLENQIVSWKNKLESKELFVKTLLHSKQIVLDQLDSIKIELKQIINDKLQLQKLNNELRSSLNNLLLETTKTNNVKRFDISRANEILEKCAKSKSTLEPLQKCVDSLKLEMKLLNSMIKKNTNIRYGISLMDELKYAK